MATATTQGRMLEKVLLGGITGGALAIAVVEIVLLARRVVELSTAETLELAGVPIEGASASEVAAASAQVTEARFESVAMTVEGAPGAARGYLIGGEVLASLLTVGICAVLVWLCLLVFVGRPFVRSATIGIGIAAVLVMLAGLGGPFLTGLAHAETVEHLALEATGLPFLAIELNLAPLGWGLALAVVAGAFELGQRMQRDTEGLI